MLKLARNWTPFPTPVVAESTNITVTTAMKTICAVAVVGMPQRNSIAPFTCSAPMPSDGMSPKSVASTAAVSSDLPTQPSTMSPRIGRQAVLIRLRPSCR